MRLPYPPSNATRFFARVHSAIFECPRCGIVYRFSPKHSGGVWDRQTCTFTCYRCHLTCIIGMICWPVKRGRPGAKAGDAGGPTIPKDQVPNERQLAQLRARAGGWWMPPEMKKKRRRPDDTNITAACTCKPGTECTDAGDPNCPIHGGD